MTKMLKIQDALTEEDIVKKGRVVALLVKHIPDIDVQLAWKIVNEAFGGGTQSYRQEHLSPEDRAELEKRLKQSIPIHPSPR